MQTIDAAFQQGLALHKQGRLDEAEALYRDVLAQQAQHFGALHFTGLIQFQRGRADEAVQWIERAVAVNSNSPDAYSNLGLAQQALKRIDAALASYDRSLQLRANNPEALCNRGNALQTLQRLPEAIASYDRALALRPNFPQVHNNRGNALRALDRLAEALASYDRALQLWPDYPDALDNRGRLLLDLKRYDEAAVSFARLKSVAPQHPYAPGLLLAARQHCCDWTDHAAASAAIVASVERGERADGPFSFFAHTTSPMAQLACARLFAAAEYPAPAQPLPVKLSPGERIRVAYLSADFHSHATAYLMADLFEAHDHSRFEIWGISYGPADGSPMRERLERAFDRFIDVRDRSDADVAGLLRESGVDIAVDLKGFTAFNRVGIFAHRAAPIQVSYLGFPATTGAPFIDYLLADRHIVPPRLEAAYSEKVVRLADSYQVNDRKRRIAEHTPTRLELGLPEHGFVFCSFNNSYKILPAIFDVWMRLLHRVAGSVLWLLADNAAAMANLRREAERRGIAASRLVFAPRVDLADHLARHRRADLFLDTFPVNAHTTASDALWTGLPVVTLCGETFVSRVAASLLNAVGLPELVAENLADYEALAMKLATTPSALADARQRLAHNLPDAPLFDTDRFRRHIESAYATMVNRYRAGQAAASFDVSD